MWETKSQNAILVNGLGQDPHSPEATGRILYFETTPDLDVVVGEAGASYPQLDRWTRAIVFVKPDLVFIHDTLEAPEPSTYQFLLHAPSEFILATDNDPPLATWTDEEVAVDIDFLFPPDLQISQKNGYDPPPHEWANFKIDEWHLTAEPEGKHSRQSFLTLLSINGSERDAEYNILDEGKGVFAIQVDDGPTLVLEPTQLSIAEEEFEREIQYAVEEP
jgi:hypothetical protein